MLAEPLPPSPLDRLAALLAGRRFLALTGAGCSTESGIPDYRGPDGSWRHGKPMSFREFTGDPRARRRYWARSAVGWRRIAGAEPNPAHRALARLERVGRIAAVVTQNVDGLHGKAGSARVIDLHGRLDRVECLGCRTRYRRDRFQLELERLNPGWLAAPARVAGAGATATARPDGDAELAGADYDAFRVPPCPRCGGDLKPGVVFFGEAVPPRRTAAAFAALEAVDGLLVVGSSLTVWSGYRFAREAVRTGKPVAIVNLGTTRADAEAALKLDARCGAALPALVAAVSSRALRLTP